MAPLYGKENNRNNSKISLPLVVALTYKMNFVKYGGHFASRRFRQFGINPKCGTQPAALR